MKEEEKEQCKTKGWTGRWMDGEKDGKMMDGWKDDGGVKG